MGEPCKHGHIDGVMHKPCPECTSEMRFENEIVLCKQIDKLNARNEELQAQIAKAEDGWHMANGVADLAMKHRNEAEAQVKELQKQVDALETEEKSWHKLADAWSSKIAKLQAKLDACTGDYRCCNYQEQKP